MTEEILHLELLFHNALGATKKITVRKPKANLSEAEVRNTIDVIAATEIFAGKDGDPYVTGQGARYVQRTIEDIYSEA